MRYIKFLFFVLIVFSFSFLSAEEYSPGVGQDYPKKLLWGDTHLHSNQSADAYTIGNSRILSHIWLEVCPSRDKLWSGQIGVPARAKRSLK